MAYLPVEDILRQARGMQKFLVDFVQRHEDKMNNDMLTGLYREIGDHSQQVEESLADLQEAASPDLLQTWIQYPGVETIESTMDQLAEVDELKDEVVLEQVLEAHQAMVDLVEQVLSQTHSNRLRELLQNLKEFEENHLRKLATGILDLQQMGNPNR